MLRLQLFAQSEEASICSLDSPLYLQIHFVVRCHPRSQIQKFFDDFKTFVVKSHALLSVANRSLVSGHNNIFCLIFVDLQSKFDRFSFQRQKRFLDSCLTPTDNVVFVYLCICVCLLNIVPFFVVLVVSKYSEAKHSVQCCCCKTY
jgi:hypothetical protein